MIENNNVYKTIWKNGNKEYYIFFTSDDFAISKAILLFLYSFHIPSIILSNVYFYIALSMFAFLLIDRNRQQVLLISWVIFFFETQKYFFALFKFLMLFQRLSTLWSSTLKITILFPGCLTLLISTLK